MISARIPPFCRKYNINIRYYDGFRVCPGFFTERKKAIKKQENRFCLIWKSQIISFNKTMEELKKLQSC